MTKTAILLCVCAAIATVQCGVLHNHGVAATTASPSTNLRQHALYISNNLPKIEKGCTGTFSCGRKLKGAEQHDFCTKYCLKHIECSAHPKNQRSGSECVELNETLVQQEFIEAKRNNALHVNTLAMIDFPCQPGYLPDSRGRCREVW